MHTQEQSLKNRAQALIESQNKIIEQAENMSAYFNGNLPALMTRRVTEVKEKVYNPLNEKLSEYAKQIDKAAEVYEASDQAIAKWFSVLGLMEHGISGARFRYVNQIGNVNGEWGEFDMYTRPGKSLDTGCNVACFTMALSSLGINVTPEDVCSKNKAVLESHHWSVGPDDNHPTLINRDFGDDLAKKYEATYDYGGNIDSYLDLYIKNPGKYSVPVVKIPNGSTDHFLVVTGKNENGTYSVVDPYNQTRQTIQASQIQYAYQLNK
jgi:hypothetical protein